MDCVDALEELLSEGWKMHFSLACFSFLFISWMKEGKGVNARGRGRGDGEE